MKTRFLLFILFFSAHIFAQKTPLKSIDPILGETPDITVDAAKNLQRLKRMYAQIDSIVKKHKSYEDAKKHLSKRQIEIYENGAEYIKEDHLDVGTLGCSWYCGGGPDSIFSSSALKPYKEFTYDARNAHDFSLRTAWVEGVPGYGVKQSISFRFKKLSPPVTTVEIYNGYMKSEKAWKDNSRVKKLKLYVNGKAFAILNLRDTIAKQKFNIGSQQGKKSDLILKFEIMEVYKGSKFDDVAIAEIEFDGTGVHCFAKSTMVAVPGGEKNIENLKIGDTVLTYNESLKITEKSIVLELSKQRHHNLYELNFEGVKIKVTDDHPFYYDNSYYSILPNTTYGVATNKLGINQEIMFYNKGSFKVLLLTAITPLNTCEETYTILKLSKNNLFFANGVCVSVESQNLIFMENTQLQVHE